MANEKPPSELVAGKYKLTRLLGRGGMGSVWEGVHVSLGNRVACKFIEPEYVQSQDALHRFENEARAAASLKSKHVVDVYDHGVMPDGRPYIVMEYLEGEPLDVRLNKLGLLTIVQTATIISQVSRALHRAHSAGIVHRDLKPENIFLVWDDEDQTDVAKVVDFGIAKFTTSSAGISSATRTGSVLGTPYYMSPEQARGLKNLDARSDNWSLGVIAYQALTGVRPYDGEALGDILVKICTVPPTAPSKLNPNLPKGVDDWMVKALAIDPAERFQDVRELSEALVTVAGPQGRQTQGSSVGAEARTVAAPSQRIVDTGRNGTPRDVKNTSGALTNAALETHILPVQKTSSVIWLLAAGALVSVGVVLAISSSGSDRNAVDPLTTQQVEGSKAVALPPMDAPKIAEQEDKTPTPEPKQAEANDNPVSPPSLPPPTISARSAARPRPAVVSPKPRPRPSAASAASRAPAPVTATSAPAAAAPAAPPAAPRPVTAPSSSNGNVDLGY